MYDFQPPASSRTPLDFNLPRRTDSVADALDPEASARDPVPAFGIDSAALLAEAGVPGHVVREVLASRSASGR